MPLRIGAHQRVHIQKGRATVVAPTPEDERVVAALAGARPREGIPMDVLITLEAIRQLADQGNLAAKWLYDRERRRLGIDRPTFHT